ncbi:GNAT family N-acetyltransferase [Actinorugispora endophytica]|uniref:Putative acetyltransferase n=1 Tax=Actinorugispora endophytica TaxID=1605990 RepID=A0A4R6USG9_9ACTN|nr:GNAT family N-acetyltransferase [Actinorugispora endophytica]TDQ48749.1 putative acetyltransferase [Actinorugispora endophytica]
MPNTHPAVAHEAWTVRPVTEPEFPDFSRTCAEALLSPVTSEERIELHLANTDLDRTLAAFDGDRIVGTTQVHSFQMALPGGVRPVAGVSAVGVLPTHRRRGVLTALMRRQLRDVYERGEAVAALFASEGGIYGRFGYGLAALSGTVTVRKGEGVLRPDAPRDPALRLRMAAPAAAREELAVVHRTAVPARVGEFHRGERWWDRVLRDPETDRGGFSPCKAVLVEDGAGPLGYALYRVKQDWDEFGNADGSLKVVELQATDPAAHAMLWEFLLNRDLVGTVTADLRPADDPLLYLLADRNRARMTLDTGFWGRLVDLPKALSERSYAAPVDVVVEVSDPVCPWNEGRWHLSADTRSAHCERTEREADLALGVGTLGSAYMGGERLTSYAAAGLVHRARPGAVAELSTALVTPALPHCSAIF